MSTAPKLPDRPSLYDKKNDAVRVDNLFELDDTVAVALRSFFRTLGAPYLFEERVLPTLKVPDSSIFVAVRDRPWPPWGHGARRVIALTQVFPVSSSSFGLSPLYVTSEETSNIGLRAALYKETLEGLSKGSKAEVNYLVIEGSVIVDRVLRSTGFKRSDDVVQTEEGRYFFYRADSAVVLDKLGLGKISIPELLSHKVDGSILDRNALYQGVLDWGRNLEIIPIDAGGFEASLPGGPPGPGTSGPPDIGNIEIITEGGE